MAWDGKKIPDAMLSRAISAANAAANGSRNSAYRDSIRNDIGIYKRQLLRDDVVVWETTASAALLTVQNNAFVLPTTFVQSSIVDADIDTGEWIHKVVSVNTPSNYIATKVTKTGGVGPMFLTDDLTASGSVVMETVVLSCPSIDTVSPPATTLSAVISAATGITSTSATVAMDVSGTIPTGAQMKMEVAPYTSTAAVTKDSRALNWASPAQTFASLDGNVLYQNFFPNNLLNTLSEPGRLGILENGATDTDYVLLRADHPYVPGAKGYRHRIKSTWRNWAPGYENDPTYRSEISQPGEGANTIQYFKTYWIAFSFTFESDILSQGVGDTSILDLHVHEDYGDYPGPGPLNFFLTNGVVSVQARYAAFNPTIPGSADVVATTSFTPSAGTEYEFVMKIRPDPFSSNGILQLWRRQGTTGTISQLINYIGPWGYNDINPYLFFKTGIYFFGYSYNANHWQNVTQRTLWTRGMYVVEDLPGTPALSHTAMFGIFGGGTGTLGSWSSSTPVLAASGTHSATFTGLTPNTQHAYRGTVFTGGTTNAQTANGTFTTLS